MGRDTRFKDRTFDLRGESGNITWGRVPIAALWDIRDELQKLNALLACPNFIGIPRTLRRISNNTAKPRRKKKAVA